MCKISDAIVDTLLDEITDYEQVGLLPSEYRRLYDICDGLRSDEREIETEINKFLYSIGYRFDDENCLWVEPDKLK